MGKKQRCKNARKVSDSSSGSGSDAGGSSTADVPSPPKKVTRVEVSDLSNPSSGSGSVSAPAKIRLFSWAKRSSVGSKSSSVETPVSVSVDLEGSGVGECFVTCRESNVDDRDDRDTPHVDVLSNSVDDISVLIEEDEESEEFSDIFANDLNKTCISRHDWDQAKKEEASGVEQVIRRGLFPISRKDPLVGVTTNEKGIEDHKVTVVPTASKTSKVILFSSFAKKKAACKAVMDDAITSSSSGNLHLEQVSSAIGNQVPLDEDPVMLEMRAAAVDVDKSLKDNLHDRRDQLDLEFPVLGSERERNAPVKPLKQEQRGNRMLVRVPAIPIEPSGEVVQVFADLTDVVSTTVVAGASIVNWPETQEGLRKALGGFVHFQCVSGYGCDEVGELLLKAREALIKKQKKTGRIYRIDRVIVALATNTLHWGRKNREEMEVAIRRMASTVEAIVQQDKKNKKVRLVWVGILPKPRWGFEALNKLIPNINLDARLLLEDKGWGVMPLADIWSAPDRWLEWFGDNDPPRRDRAGNKNPDFRGDGLHPTKAGSVAIVQAWGKEANNADCCVP